MTIEVQDEELISTIKTKATKNGILSGECIIRYDGSMYLVNLDEDKVVLQYNYE